MAEPAAVFPEIANSTNVFELFLALYRVVAEEGQSEIVRRIFTGRSTAAYDEWRHETHPLALAVSQSIARNPIAWMEDFPVSRDRLAGCLAEALQAASSLENE